MKGKFTAIILFFSIVAYTNAETINENKLPFSVENTPGKVILNVKFMKQKEMGCSRTSFAMVMHYYNPSITLEMVERDAPKASDGGSQNNLMAVLAEQYGFKTHAFPGTVKDLIKNLKSGKPIIVAQYPSLAEKNSNHDRVVTGFDQNKGVLFVHDPSVGENISYSYEQFQSLWESNVGLDDKYYSVLITPKDAQSKKIRNINVDGMEEDWEGMESFSGDRADDTVKSDLHLNITKVYCFKDNAFIYLKTNFINSPKTDPSIIYFFNFFFIKNGISGLKQLNFRLNQSPFAQIDGKAFEPLTNVEWKLGKVFEAKIGLENFEGLPDIVSIQAGIYDTKRKKFIDVSYPNAFNIKKH